VSLPAQVGKKFTPPRRGKRILNSVLSAHFSLLSTLKYCATLKVGEADRVEQWVECLLLSLDSRRHQHTLTGEWLDRYLGMST